jgi:hypothetical protein
MGRLRVAGGGVGTTGGVVGGDGGVPGFGVGKYHHLGPPFGPPGIQMMTLFGACGSQDRLPGSFGPAGGMGMPSFGSPGPVMIAG